MTRWSEFAAAAPELAEAGQRLITTARDGVAFLATVRRGGSPQLHPVAPRFAEGGLYLFIVNLSTKYGDLLRDGRYALHALPGPENSEEFLVRGRATAIIDAEARARLIAATGAGSMDFEVPFELDIASCLHTTWANWGKPGIWPSYTRWRAQ